MEEKKLTDEELNKLIKALEYQSWAQNCPELSQAAYMLKYQKAEIERLKETSVWKENEQLKRNLQRKEILRQKVVLYAEEQYAKNAELQKQVDELKEQNEVFKKIFDNTNGSSITEEQIINAMNSFYREQAEHLFELKKEQAVKDTAKEIYKEIGKDDILVVETQEYGEIEVVPLERLQEIIKSKGVEVE